MNISRLNSVPANLQPASARPYQAPKSTTAPEKGVESKPHATHHASKGTSTARAQGADDGDGDVDSTNYGERISNYASEIDTRLSNAIQNGNLSDEQVQSLKDASAKFQQLMQRIGNADFAKSPKRQVMFALHQLSHEIQSVLHPEETQPSATSTLGGDSSVAGATALPTIDAVG
jgi:hypothetical protein